MKSLNEIKHIIKQNILIDRLDLEDITTEDIQDNQPLFGEGLGLDSVEALDVVAGIEAEFGVKLQGMDQEAIRTHFYSVEALSQFVLEQLSTAVNE